VAEAVNSTLSVWTRTGSPVASISLDAFFSVPNASGYFFSDPRIVYDGLSGRWFLSGMSVDPSASSGDVYLAVSTTSDPTGGWDIYDVASGAGVFADQPKLGVSSDKVVLSWDDFSNSTFTGQETWVLQKSDLLSGGTVSIYNFAADTTRFDVVPAVSQTPTSSEYLVYNNSCSAQAGNGSGSCTVGTPTLGVVIISGTPAANNVTWTEADPGVTATTGPPAGTQPSGPAIETNDDRLLSAVWQNGNLWASGNDACVPSTVVQSCLRLFEVSTASNSMLVDGDLGFAGQDLYYPAVALDGLGDVYLAATQSSSTLYPSVVVFGKSTTSAAFVGVDLPEPDGGASYLGNRWGDYSGAAMDPANPSVVWLAGEYSTQGGNPNWGTAVAETSFASPTGLTWWNGSSGSVTSWLLDGAGTVLGSQVLNKTCGTLGGCASNWQPVGVADVNGDGHADVMWWDPATGALSTWLLNGSGTVLGYQPLNKTCGPGCASQWRPVGLADINGDGHADLMWWDPATGALSTWLLNGSGTVLGYRALSKTWGPAGSSNQWRPVGLSHL
jgi:hypothetical protein